VGLVALLNGSVVGLFLLAGGAALIVWSVLKPRA
jgi:hypothetical protein